MQECTNSVGSNLAVGLAVLARAKEMRRARVYLGDADEGGLQAIATGGNPRFGHVVHPEAVHVSMRVVRGVLASFAHNILI